MYRRFVTKLNLLAFDIETDTSGGPNMGLKPYDGGITCLGFAGSDGRRTVFELNPRIEGGAHRLADGARVVQVPTERQLLERVEQYVARTAPGTLVGWNSALFDLAFLSTRSRLISAADGKPEPLASLKVFFDPAHRPTWRPLEGHPGGLRGVWGKQIHADIMPAFYEWAQAQGMKNKLKVVCKAQGFPMIELDRTKMHEYSDKELIAYQLSDIDGTLFLGQKLGEKILEVRDHQFAAQCARLVGGPSRFD